VNNLSYRRLGDKEWEVSLVYKNGTNAGTAGSGDYLFTLPNSLSFDTTVPLQGAYQANVANNTPTLAYYTIPASGLITNNTICGQVYPIVWDATRFRIMATSYNDSPSSIRCWGSAYYQLSGTAGGIKLRFTFTST
jgi:hypothetical protein